MVMSPNNFAKDYSPNQTILMQPESESEPETGRSLPSGIMDLGLGSEALEALDQQLSTQAEMLRVQMMFRTDNYHRHLRRTAGKIADMASRKAEVKKDMSVAVSKHRHEIALRDLALADLRGVEQAFSDVHRKYERAKQILENLKHNEEVLKARDYDIQMRIMAKDHREKGFQREVQEVIERMYEDYDSQAVALEHENARLTAKLRRSEMRAETLFSELQQKEHENDQLNNLCDELLGKSAR